MAIKTNIVLDQGSDFLFTFDLVDDNDVPIDLTGFTGKAMMRKFYTSLKGHSFTVDVTTDGEVTLSMDSRHTSCINAGRYVYDCELTSSDGQVSRIIEGIVTVTPRVSK